MIKVIYFISFDEASEVCIVYSLKAVARGIIIRKMLIACFGTFRALWSALLLLREAFRGKKLYFPLTFYGLCFIQGFRPFENL